MSKLEFCYGTSVLLLISYFYFQYKLSCLREELDYRFSEEGVKPVPENFHLVEKMVMRDEYLRFLFESYRDSLFHSKVSLFCSLSLLIWCFVI